MIAAIGLIIAKIAAAIAWIGRLFVAVFEALWDLLADAFAWCFDQVLGVAVAAIGAIDLGPLESVVGWGELPAEMINILLLIGLPEASAIIVAAIGIRLTLQLIPFTRLGS